MIDNPTTAADERRILEFLLYMHDDAPEALHSVVKEAREVARGHTLTIGIGEMAISALGLADHPERVDALRARIRELREIEEDNQL